ncbi:methyltransferase [Kribbella sp. NPDC050459]|uniref:methyltransferase n=1 Tax=Kribbella sp. NPDC050459 TaxID=3155785 RepID=UPI0033D91DD4
MDEAEYDALSRLPGALERHGFASFLAAFPPHATRRDRWAREADRLDGSLRSLVDLLLLQRCVSRSALPSEVVAALPVLVAADVAQLDGTHVSLPRLSLFRPHGVWLLAEPPGPTQVDTYFGPDSLALAMHASYGTGRSCLDLCAGPGFQGLTAAASCATVTLVELMPRAAAIAVLNAALNGAIAKVDVRVGDLYDAVNGERYDHVVANVPFMPVPPGHSFPVAGAGGPDGFAIARRVLGGLPEHLEPGGSAFLATMLLRDEDGDLLLRDELAAWAAQAGYDVTVLATSAIPATPASPLVRGTAEAMASGRADLIEQFTGEITDHYATLGARTATWAFLRVGEGDRGLSIVDLGSTGRLAPWVSMV